MEIKGKFGNAVIYSTDIEEYAIAQIQMICDNEVSKDSSIRVMPDVHPGMVGPIGLTMKVKDIVIPNLLGVDIGCGMTTVKFKSKNIEFAKLDKVIKESIPSGFKLRNYYHNRVDEIDLSLSKLYCYSNINLNKVLLSLGTLGGGNHFIEIDNDEKGEFYLTVHSGSRRLGKEVTEYYIRKGQEVIKERGENVPYEMTYIDKELMYQYLNDVYIVQEYAILNRDIILSEIMKGMKFKEIERYSCIHNYIDSYTSILRKGAISAMEGEKVIIPINMKDGIILGTGKGNKEWNYSAPHGSGRILARSNVKNHYTVSAFKKSMKGIYSTCINENTLDESPFAYRGIDYIKEAIKDTVEIDSILKPIYNYKSADKE